MGRTKVASVGDLTVSSVGMVSVSSDSVLSIGAPNVYTVGTNYVEMPEVVTSCIQPQKNTAGLFIPGLNLAASLPSVTAVAPSPIMPQHYIFESPAAPGPTPEDPGPGEGKTSREQITRSR